MHVPMANIYTYRYTETQICIQIHTYIHLYLYIYICAGAYVSGAAGSNACPAGSVRIETEAACRTAAAAAGKTVGSPFVETLSTYPRGCYYITGTNEAFFNAHAVGAGYSLQLLCAALVATTGAPHVARRRCARAFVPAVRGYCALCRYAYIYK
jgi:hypothetical protein